MYREPYTDMKERILANSAWVGGCRCWTGYRDRCGYGRISVWDKARKVVRKAPAHRIAYETFVGPIPPGHDVDHAPECDRSCIWPDHLTPRPYREHRLRTLPHYARRNPPGGT